MMKYKTRPHILLLVPVTLYAKALIRKRVNK